MINLVQFGHEGEAFQWDFWRFALGWQSLIGLLRLPLKAKSPGDRINKIHRIIPV
jgi:hypothetical protein